MSDSEINRYFVSIITYNNLKMLVSGFMNYSRHSVEKISPETCIPALHLNQNNLEYLSSRIRFMGKDRTDSYAGGVLHIFSVKYLV